MAMALVKCRGAKNASGSALFMVKNTGTVNGQVGIQIHLRLRTHTNGTSIGGDDLLYWWRRMLKRPPGGGYNLSIWSGARTAAWNLEKVVYK
jgi:hypothetical protein